MDMNTKTTAAKPAGFPKTDAPQAFREMAEKGTAQAQETYEKMSAATTEAADLIKDSYSTSVRGALDYNNKFIEFARANTNATFDFAQKLSGVKSSSEFVELSTEHARQQLDPPRPLQPNMPSSVINQSTEEAVLKRFWAQLCAVRRCPTCERLFRPEDFPHQDSNHCAACTIRAFGCDPPACWIPPATRPRRGYRWGDRP